MSETTLVWKSECSPHERRVRLEAFLMAMAKVHGVKGTLDQAPKIVRQFQQESKQHNANRG